MERRTGVNRSPAYNNNNKKEKKKKKKKEKKKKKKKKKEEEKKKKVRPSFSKEESRGKKVRRELKELKSIVTYQHSVRDDNSLLDNINNMNKTNKNSGK